MARGMNALQLALGSVGAGIQGYSQARTLREEQKAEKERLRKAEARQMAMDLANLQSQGYEAVPEVQRKQQAAIGAAGSMIGSALNAASGGSMGQLPSTEAQKYLSQGYAGAKPERTLEYGGQQLALRETANERQERLAREQEMRQRKAVEDAANAKAQETARNESVISRALGAQATEADKASAIARGLLTPGQAGYMTAAEKAQAERQKRLDELQERKLNAEIKKLNESGDTGRPMTPTDLARLSEAQASARTATAFMRGIESDWEKKNVTISPLDVARVQELMEGKGFTIGKAIASVWGVLPGSAGKETRQQLEDYMSYAKMHSNSIRLIAARGGSNLLQQTEQQLVNSAWSGGGPEDIRRARVAREAIDSSLENAMEAAGVSLKLREAEERRGGGTASPAATSGGGGFMSYDEWLKRKK